MHVLLSRPNITQREIQLVNEVLQTSFLSMGAKTEEFERKLADYVRTKHAIGVVELMGIAGMVWKLNLLHI